MALQIESSFSTANGETFSEGRPAEVQRPASRPERRTTRRMIGRVGWSETFETKERVSKKLSFSMFLSNWEKFFGSSRFILFFFQCPALNDPFQVPVTKRQANWVFWVSAVVVGAGELYHHHASEHPEQVLQADAHWPAPRRVFGRPDLEISQASGWWAAHS